MLCLSLLFLVRLVLLSAVCARGPALNTVMRPSPLIQYCHSSAFGCQCMPRIAPGFSVSKAAAIEVETLKVVLSARRIEPEAVSADRLRAARAKR